MKKAFIIMLAFLAPFFAKAQENTENSKNFFIYNIVTFEGNFKDEGLKVNIDNGKTVEKLRDSNGKKIEFRTPAAALMFFLSKGWELFTSGGTTEGDSAFGFGGTQTMSYWIFRRPCTEEEFQKTAEEGVKR